MERVLSQFKAVIGKRAQILPDIPLTILRLSCDRVKGNVNPGSLQIGRQKFAVTRPRPNDAPQHKRSPAGVTGPRSMVRKKFAVFRF